MFVLLAGKVELGTGSAVAPGAVKMELHGNERGAIMVDSPTCDAQSFSLFDGFGEGTTGGNIRNGSGETSVLFCPTEFNMQDKY